MTAIDPNGHATVSYLDPLGRTVYVQLDSGKFGGTFTVNELKTVAYNVLNEPTSITVTDEATQSGQSVTSVTTTASYDDLGRLITLNDPDRGLQSYTYDADGQLITNVSSGSRTIGYVYDLLGRIGCVQNIAPTESATGACSSGANAHIKNTYDTSTLGTQGSTDFPIGRLTKSVATTYYPGGTSAQVTELYQHDKRGRLINEKLSFSSLPSGWNITTALPSYKVQYTYNDANQLTTTQTSTAPVGQGYTTTQVYDTTTGVQTGLSDNSTNTPDLATLSFNTQAQISSINYLTSGGSSALAVDQFSYDGDMRPITDTANWQSGSGNGTSAIFSQSRAFDPAGNLTSLTTTHAAVPGVSGSGGTETSNFCYDEQNRLVWAGNSGTQPGAGNGTCGSGTLSSGLTGASYSNSYVYTHLGQLYQAPLNGSGTQEQYLYCGSSGNSPHQLIGLYPTSSGATCSNFASKTADYSSSYDGFGNVTSRTTGSVPVTDTLSYDLLDQLTKWSSNATGQTQLEQYVYDAGGNRVLRRSTSGPSSSPTTTMTVYAFGLEEHSYTGSGTNQGNTYYYSLAGRLIGSNDANGTVFYMTDTLGSVLASFTNTPNTATIKGNQVYGPYGNSRYSQGTINTFKGFTGQYNDSLTGLDYYGARYYDPVAGVFLSADRIDGNNFGLNPYAYVNGNPETFSDPTGLAVAPPIAPPLPVAPPPPVDPPTTPPPVIPIVGACLANIVGCITAGGFFGLSFIIWFGPRPQPRPQDPNTPQLQPAPTPTPAGELGTLSGDTASPVTGPLSGNGAAQPVTKTGSNGGGIVPPAPPVSSTPPSDENPDPRGFGKLTNRDIRVSECGIGIVEKHLSRPNFLEPDGSVAPENLAMIERLRAALAGGRTISGADASFYMHELYESTLMDQGMSYEEAHQAALARYGVSDFSVYAPEVIQAFYPDRFNSNWMNFWNISTQSVEGDIEC